MLNLQNLVELKHFFSGNSLLWCARICGSGAVDKNRSCISSWILRLNNCFLFIRLLWLWLDNPFSWFITLLRLLSLCNCSCSCYRNLLLTRVLPSTTCGLGLSRGSSDKSFLVWVNMEWLTIWINCWKMKLLTDLWSITDLSFSLRNGHCHQTRISCFLMALLLLL